MLYGRQAIKVMDLRWEATAFKDRKKPQKQGVTIIAPNQVDRIQKRGALMTIKKLLQGSIRLVSGPELSSGMNLHTGRYRMQALSKGHLPTWDCISGSMPSKMVQF